MGAHVAATRRIPLRRLLLLGLLGAGLACLAAGRHHRGWAGGPPPWYGPTSGPRWGGRGVAGGPKWIRAA